jgi:hypothetical protein
MGRSRLTLQPAGEGAEHADQVRLVSQERSSGLCVGGEPGEDNIAGHGLADRAERRLSSTSGNVVVIAVAS